MSNICSWTFQHLFLYYTLTFLRSEANAQSICFTKLNWIFISQPEKVSWNCIWNWSTLQVSVLSCLPYAPKDLYSILKTSGPLFTPFYTHCIPLPRYPLWESFLSYYQDISKSESGASVDKSRYVDQNSFDMVVHLLVPTSTWGLCDFKTVVIGPIPSRWPWQVREEKQFNHSCLLAVFFQ